MKRIVLISVIVLAGIVSAMAQKFAYIDSDYILKNIPAYEAAHAQLDQQSVEWQKEIEAMYTQIDKMYKDFQAEKPYLTKELQTKRENEIISKEKEAKELQKKYFGKDGELYKKRQELVKPIQDDVYNAVKQIAVEGNYAMIFDVSGGVSVIYTDPKFDRSDEVLQKLGYKK